MLKTGQLKQFQEQHKGNETAFSMAQPSQSSSATAAATSYKMGPPPPPPPPPPKESFARRYRFLWPLLLVVNLAVGGQFFSFYYLFILCDLCVCFCLLGVDICDLYCAWRVC